MFITVSPSKLSLSYFLSPTIELKYFLTLKIIECPSVSHSFPSHHIIHLSSPGPSPSSTTSATPIKATASFVTDDKSISLQKWRASQPTILLTNYPSNHHQLQHTAVPVIHSTALLLPNLRYKLFLLLPLCFTFFTTIAWLPSCLLPWTSVNPIPFRPVPSRHFPSPSFAAHTSLPPQSHDLSPFNSCELTSGVLLLIRPGSQCCSPDNDQTQSQWMNGCVELVGN